jgi:hypothetical protein
MASSINGDTLSTLGSSQFDNLSFAERDRLDVELEEFLNIEENSISDEFERFIKVITPRTSPKQPSINKSRETKSASPALHSSGGLNLLTSPSRARRTRKSLTRRPRSLLKWRRIGMS